MKRIRNTNTKSNLFITVDLKECILILRKVLTSLYFSLKSRKFYGFSFQFIFPEAVVWRCSVKKVFLDISQNSQGIICDRASFLIKLQLQIFLEKVYHISLTDYFFWKNDRLA